MNKRLKADLSGFARAQRRAYMAGYHTSPYDTHTRAIREHVKRGNTMPTPSPVEAFTILDQGNLLAGESFVPLLDVKPE